MVSAFFVFINQNQRIMKIKQIHSKQIILSLLMAMFVVSCSDNSDTSDPNKPNVVAKDVKINPTNFPDDNFRAYLLAQDYGADGIITKEEFQEIKRIEVSSKNISSLKGIEYFVALDTLSCGYNSLSSLDVSKNTVLTYLDCGYNSLSSLDVFHNTALTKLYCYANSLSSLDVSHNTSLTSLICWNNSLSSLDVSHNTALTSLDCDNNPLSSLDVSHNTALTSLDCRDNSLSSLDVSHNTALTLLLCSGNSLSSLDVSHNTALTYLDCSANSLSSLDVSHNTALTSLDCRGNQIRGEAMDALIEGLPQTNGKIYAIGDSSKEGNICTKSQVAAIKAKGWTPYCLYNSDWAEYEGSDDNLQ